MYRSAAPVFLIALVAWVLLPFACAPEHPVPEAVVDAGGPFGDAGNHDEPDAGVVRSGPKKLSETGLYSDFEARTLAPGVIPFEPRFELWSDGAGKARYLLLPPGTQIDTTDMDNWRFPVGTRAWKEFTFDGGLVETRLLWKQAEGAGGWFRSAYVWNGDHSEALAAPDGEIDAAGTDHDVPSQLTCERCHDNVRDTLIGVSALQLSRPGEDGGIAQWAAAGLLSAPPGRELDVPGTGIVHDALGYLHGNCGHCHRPGNWIAEKKDLRLDVSVTDTQPGDTGAYQTTFGAKTTHAYEGTTQIVVPGAAEKSQLWQRSRVRDASPGDGADGYQMPPFCTEKIDDAGVELIREWIEQL